jgi:hypothetical protein
MKLIKKLTMIKLVCAIACSTLLVIPLFISSQEPSLDVIQEENCYCNFCNEIKENSTIKTCKLTCPIKKKTVDLAGRTIIIYMAADNDLRVFAARNIQQMTVIGSNENLTILVHLDIRISGNKKITRRYLIEKDKVVHIDPYNVFLQQMDSGNPATLISCCEWAIKNYPAEAYDLFLWNHGTGILEPPHGKIINPMDLFIFNPSTHLLELDRSIGFLDMVSQKDHGQRGVCWDDTTGNYLSNRKLDTALQTIRLKFLNGKKFGIIGFDACLMSMAEVCSFIKKHAIVMVGSQEVELGMGWKYDEVLFPFARESLDTYSFARHIVNAYEKTYQSITHDYTLSAINLSDISQLEKNIDDVSKLLIENLINQKSIYTRLIKESRAKQSCTYFDEPSYIDLHHFYTNLLTNINKIDSELSSQGKKLKNDLMLKLNDGITLIKKLVIANTCGRNLKGAQGISIYFPERGIHSSYKEAFFHETNRWGSFLSQYLLG